MAYNNMTSGYLNSFQPQTWNRSTAGDPVMNKTNDMLNYSANRADQRRDIEWANRQQMYDPGFWASAFGMSGSSGGGAGRPTYQDTVGRPTYQDTAKVYRTRLDALMDNPDSIANTGAYKFAFNQGQEALNRQLAAKGLLNSGNRLYELTKFGQGLASQQYGAEVDRLGNLVNSTRAGDINRYGADASLYGTELQGQNQLRSIELQAQNQLRSAELQAQNQLRSMMMQNMLNRFDRQEASSPQYW